DVGSVSTEMNWKGVGISLLVIAFVLSLIGLSIFLLSKGLCDSTKLHLIRKENELVQTQCWSGQAVSGDAHHTLGTCLTLDDLFSTQRLVYKDRHGDLKMLNMETNQTDVLMKNTTFAEFKASKFAVSPDLKYVLLAYDVRKSK
ncbi:hypothetical protein cypCar_00048198, partial [Cyprinus carpio]